MFRLLRRDEHFAVRSRFDDHGGGQRYAVHTLIADQRLQHRAERIVPGDTNQNASLFSVGPLDVLDEVEQVGRLHAVFTSHFLLGRYAHDAADDQRGQEQTASHRATLSVRPTRTDRWNSTRAGSAGPNSGWRSCSRSSPAILKSGARGAS